MRVTFFGTRGSLPVPGPGTVRYGGNTACVLVETRAGTRVVLDMGSGAYALGQQLAAGPEPPVGHILISHTHWDHIQGFPFFAPFFRTGSRWDVYAPRTVGPSLRQALAGQMQHTYFPLELDEFAASIRYHDLVEGRFVIDDLIVDTRYLHHTALTLGYRLQADGATVVYALDHEPHAADWSTGEGTLTPADQAHIDFVAGADLLIHDAQYTAEDYASKAGWGHSPVDYAIAVASHGRVRRLAITHHDPQRDDAAMDALAARYGAMAADAGVELLVAAEGLVLEESRLDTGAGSSPGWSFAHATAGTPAMAGMEVLIVGTEEARMTALQEVCASDDLAVRLCAPQDLASHLVDRPSLLVFVAPIAPDDFARCAALVAERQDLGEPIIVVVAHRRDEDPDVPPALAGANRLVEPWSKAYARARIRAWLMRRACRWLRPAIPAREPERLAALEALDVLDRPPDETLNTLVDAACDLFQVPIAAVTLIDEDRQWFCASAGLAERETSRDESFCAHVVGAPRPLVVPDTLLDDRFADNPVVTGPIRVRSYAGHPLVLSNGHCIGTFCVADVQPKHFTPEGLRQLARFAEMARAALEGEGKE